MVEGRGFEIEERGERGDERVSSPNFSSGIENEKQDCCPTSASLKSSSILFCGTGSSYHTAFGNNNIVIAAVVLLL